MKLIKVKKADVLTNQEKEYRDALAELNAVLRGWYEDTDFVESSEAANAALGEIAQIENKLPRVIKQIANAKKKLQRMV